MDIAVFAGGANEERLRKKKKKRICLTSLMLLSSSYVHSTVRGPEDGRTERTDASARGRRTSSGGRRPTAAPAGHRKFGFRGRVRSGEK